MKLKKGELYEVRGDSSYVVKVTSDLIYDHYLATLVEAYNFDIKLYLSDWESIRELSSLEKALL